MYDIDFFTWTVFSDHCVHYYDLRYPKKAVNVFRGHGKAVSYVKFLNGTDMVSA